MPSPAASGRRGFWACGIQHSAVHPHLAMPCVRSKAGAVQAGGLASHTAPGPVQPAAAPFWPRFALTARRAPYRLGGRRFLGFVQVLQDDRHTSVDVSHILSTQ